jgi:hypothetical protein
VPAGGALHAGDTVAEDGAGALAAGVRPVLVARDGAPADPVPDDVPVVRDLRGVLEFGRGAGTPPLS